MNTPTLQDLRKAKYKTIQQFADAAGMTHYEASMWLRCKHNDVNEEPLLVLLGITRDEYTDARLATQEYEEKKWREKHPPATPEQIAAWEACIKETWLKMSESDKRRVHEDAVRLGFVQERRSPLDRMIDQACGLE